MKFAFAYGFVAVFGVMCCSCTQRSTPTQTSRFHAGEVWSFHTAADELPGATLTIIQVDIDPELGPIIYTSISGVRRRKSQAQLFFPFSEDALGRSVISLLRSDSQIEGKDLADFQWFYRTHLGGVGRGEAGKCFAKTVAEVLEADRK